MVGWRSGRHLADRQVSPTELAFVPMLIENAMEFAKERMQQKGRPLPAALVTQT
jgi:hypothetical protein